VPASAYGRLPLNALRVFEAVATRLSFSEAADALNVTPAAVSQQIKALEEYLQIPVLRRSGRKVELTPEGAKLLPGVQSGLDALVAVLRETRMVRASGIINISTLSSLLQKWITPRLHGLNTRFPELRVDWHTSRESVDFSRSDFHIFSQLIVGSDHTKPATATASARLDHDGVACFFCEGEGFFYTGDGSICTGHDRNAR